MAIKLEKGQRINLEKETGAKLTNFCVGCNWGAIIKKTFFGLSTSVVDVDLDLSCMMFDANGNVVDHIWSPLYQFNGKLPQGKLDSNDRALHHTGDDLTGDQNGDDGLDNEIITVDLNRVSYNVNSIVFFLNIYNNNEYNFQRPYSETTAKIMDDEVLKMINEQYQRAKALLTEHQEGHNQLAELLIEKEVIFAEDVEKIFGKRPWQSRSAEIMEEKQKTEAENAEGAEKVEQQGTEPKDE